MSSNPHDYDDGYTELRGGLVLPNKVLNLACDLEREGWRLSRAGDKLSVRDADDPDKKPDKNRTDRTELPEETKTLIRQYRDHLLAVVDYVQTTISGPS